jgi:hypothetical protein
VSLHTTDSRFIVGVATNYGHDMSWRGSMLLHLIALTRLPSGEYGTKGAGDESAG